MKERPILFSAPMVRAILDGSKTQTRRVCKIPEKAEHVQYWSPPSGRSQPGWADPGVNYWTESGNHIDPCPYGQPGDSLWVRETWGMFEPNPDMVERKESGFDWKWIAQNPTALAYWKRRVAYRASCMGTSYGNDPEVKRWRPSIHMPRALSRITLEITGVHVERLQDIGVEECIAEGANVHQAEIIKHGCSASIMAYRSIWESINGTDSWDANPWVWVIEFKKVTT